MSRSSRRRAGKDFERRVARDLEDAGWRAKRTMVSSQAGGHDQVDVHAENGSVELDVECKFRSARSNTKTIKIKKSELDDAAKRANGGAVPVLAVNSRMGPLYVITRDGIARLIAGKEDGS